MQTILKDSFREPLLQIISFLRRRTLQRARMKSTCLSVCTTRWTSLGPAGNWLCTNRDEVQKHMEDKATVAAPKDVWWVTSVDVKSFMRMIDDCFPSIPGCDTLLCEQNKRLHQLYTELRSLVCIAGPLSNIALLTAVCEGEVLTSFWHRTENMLYQKLPFHHS